MRDEAEIDKYVEELSIVTQEVHFQKCCARGDPRLLRMPVSTSK